MAVIVSIFSSIDIMEYRLDVEHSLYPRDGPTFVCTAEKMLQNIWQAQKVLQKTLWDQYYH